MKNALSVVSRLAAAALIASVVARSSSMAFAATGETSTGPSGPPVRVTANDVEASNQKIRAAYSALVQMWTNDFNQIGERFAAPRILRYTRSGYTSCGLIRANNAMYCPTNNTIYYDEIFVAGMAKLAANSVGTDGDMAAVGIIAHEMGHAVAMQLGHASRNSYENESTADCLAGAFTQQADKDGQIEPGDIDEAFFRNVDGR
jgi:predicted metalloprotease